MMRRLGFVFLFLFAAAAWGQADTTVVGKAVTSKGVLYARGSVTAVLVDTRGNEISSTRQRAATMDADGNFSIPLVAQRRWKLTLCASRPAAGGCFTVTVTVGSNSPQDISRALVQAALGAGPAVTSTSTTSTDTTVIGNAIISSNGVLYAHGSVTATLVDSSGNDLSSSPVLIGGVPVTIPQRQTNLDSAANFSIPLVAQATISQPNNTNWKLNICSQNPVGNPPGVPPMVCFIYTVTVGTTSPQDISSTLNAIPPPPIQGGGGGGGGVCGVAGELIWNNSSSCASTTGMTWTSSSQYLNNPTGAISASFISGQNVGTGGGFVDTFAWNPANGLPSHSVACIGAAGTAIVCPVNTTHWSGIVWSTSVSAGIATVFASGNAQCQFDGPATVGNIAVTSTVTAGYCHDSGSGSLPVIPSATVIGPIVASTGSLATVLMGGSAVSYPGVSSDGSGGLNAPAGTVSAQSVTGQTVGGSRYASQWQTPPGTGNNGIANAQAANQTVIAEPTYAATERPGISSFSFSPLHYQDLRLGQETNFYYNPQFPPNNFWFGGLPYGPISQAGINNYCLFDKNTNPWTGDTNAGCQNGGNFVNAPGWSIGNPSGFGAGAAHGWSTTSNLVLTTLVRGAGITESLGGIQYKYGPGDNAFQYNYVYGEGGAIAASDEGTFAYGGNTIEDSDWYTTVCNTGCSNGSVLLHTSVGSNGKQGTGRYLIDTTKGAVYTGHITGNPAPTWGSISALTVDTTVPVSTAWGTATAAINTPITPTAPFSSSQTFSLNITGSPGSFVAGTLICFGGSFHEQAIPTAVGTPSGGVQSITVPLRRPHAGGTTVMQGGVCGTALEIANDTHGGLIYPLDVIGSTTANTIQATLFRIATNNNVPFSNTTANATMSITALASGGTLVTGSANYTGAIPAGASIQISGASDSAFNALCTGVAWPDSSQFTCTIAGLSGTHTATTATGTIVGLNGFNLYNMAEVIDVQNEAVTPPAVDGTLALEPNAMLISASDNMAELHSAAGTFKTYSAGYFVNNPYTLGGPLVIGMNGLGVTGGGGSLTSNAAITINATNSGVPNVLSYGGPYWIAQNYSQYPSGAWLNMQVSSATDPRVLDPKFGFPLWNIIGNNGIFQFNFSPYGNDATMTGLRYLNFNSNFTSPGPLSGPLTIYGNTLLQTSARPAVTAVLSNTGGILPDATTRCYIIQPYLYPVGTGGDINGAPSSPEACVTTGTVGGTSSVKVTWSAVAGASQYRVCSGASGAEVNVISPGGPTVTLTWIDTGVLTAGPSCNALTSPQQHPYIDGAAWYGFNSQGTGASAQLKAPNGIGATYTEVLPLTATAGQLVDSASGATSVTGNIPSFANTTFRLQDSGKTFPLAATLTTTAAATDNVTVTGMTSSGHCSLTATNASAATNIATTYISAKAANQITVTHTATASMTYDIICTAY